MGILTFKELPRSTVLIGITFLLLSGCSTFENQAHLITSTASCTLHPSPPLSGTSLAVLQATFKRVRLGTPLALETVAPPVSKVGATKGDLDNSLLVEPSESSQPMKPFSVLSMYDDLRNAAKEVAPKNDDDPKQDMATTVEQELASRIPWISDDVVFKPQQTSESNSAAKDGLSLINFLNKKSDPLLSTNAGKQTTTFGKEDIKQLHPVMQKLAVFEPFHLITIQFADAITRYLDKQETATSGQPIETQRLIDLVYTFNTAVFLSEYFDEYFRGNQPFQLTVTPTSLQNDVVKRVNGELSSPLSPVDEQKLRNALASICSTSSGVCAGLPTLGSGGFVTLFGQPIQFDGITVAWGNETSKTPWNPTVTKPSVTVIAPQMLQVFTEALFDANGPHPASLDSSTACTKKLFKDWDTSGQCVATLDEKGARINLVGNRTEAIITAGTGVAIRGFNVASLNNEAVASIVETFAGVFSRKLVQQVASSDNCEAPSVSVEPVQASN